MAGFEGMDTDGAQMVVNALNNAPSDIQNIISNLTNQIQGINWQGPDQGQFISNWQSTVSQLTNTVNNLLSETAQHLSQEIQQQESASAS